MNPHFFTAPFCIRFMVQVSGFRVVVRIAILSYRHFERSREIFLADRWRSMFEARKTQDEGVVSLQGHVRCQPQCKKDPSATLGMTKGGNGWVHKGGALSF